VREWRSRQIVNLGPAISRVVNFAHDLSGHAEAHSLLQLPTVAGFPSLRSSAKCSPARTTRIGAQHTSGLDNRAST
jgi:hypothetical protein